MVRKSIVVGLTMVLVLVLVACGGSQDTTSTGAGDTAQPAAGQQFDVGDMPLSSLLPVGTLMLEETEYAVTPEQAQELLPLWQMVRALEESGTASEMESEAVMKQIQETMTAEQLAAIEEMDQEDMAGLMQDIGMRQQAQESADDDDDRGGFPMGGGGMPMGDMGGMPGGPMGGGEEAQGTPGAGQGMMGGFGTAFVDQVIELLEARAAEA